LTGVARYLLTGGTRADADADGVRDARDRCPGPFSRDRRGCPSWSSELSAFHRREGTLEGRLRTRKQGWCEEIADSRDLRILLVSPGRDRVIARPEIDYPGEWSTRLPVSRGRVYARAKRLLDPRFGICGAAVSRRVALR
jgi:hypothetical protein